MTFANNLAVLPQEPPLEEIIPSEGTQQFADEMIHSIISFLERPQLLHSFLWSPIVGNTVGSDLLFSNPRVASSPPGVLVPSQVFRQMQLKKLDGFAGFRATLVVKLQINNQPFNAGRLIMAAVPMPTLLRDRAEYIQKTISNIQCINHVQMDIIKQTEVELRIPFISPYNCYDLSTGNFDWARLYVKVYGPLNSTTNESLECVIWYHFEDIYLGFPTSTQLKSNNLSVPVQQSGTLSGYVKNYGTHSFKKNGDSWVYNCKTNAICNIFYSCASSVFGSSMNLTIINGNTTILDMDFHNTASGSISLLCLIGTNTFTFKLSESGNVNVACWENLVNNVIVQSPLNIVNTQDTPLFLTAGSVSTDVNINSINNDILPIWVTNTGPVQNDSFPTYNDDDIPMEQAGRLNKTIRAPRPRVPPKEASAKRINKERVEESHGAFYNTVTGIAKKISGTVGYFGKAIGSIGDIFGWSKPQIGYAGITTVSRPCQYFSNCDGIDHSHVLSLSLMNNVDSFQGLSGTELDECDFEFVKRIPNLFTYFNYDSSAFIPTGWSGDTFYGDASEILAQWFVSPVYSQPWQFESFVKTYTQQMQLVASEFIEDAQSMPTSLAYAISPFAYWTGSLVYTFRFIKTDFHSGRIELSYHPFANHFVTKNNCKILDKDQFERFDYCYRVVVDLRDNSEVSLTIPYVSPQPWKIVELNKETFDPLKDTVHFDSFSNPQYYVNENNIQNYSSGLFVVRRLTPLILSSAVVAKSIAVMVEVRAGDDFCVSCPTHSAFYPFSFPRTDQGNAIVPTQQSGVFATPGTMDTRSKALEGFVPPSITGNINDIQRDDMQMYTAGEIFENFRAFTRRFNFSYVITPTATSYIKYGQSRVNQQQAANENALLSASVIVRPDNFINPPTLPIWAAYFSYPDENFTNEEGFKYAFRPNILPTPLSYVGGMYCFYRGGVRFKTTAIQVRDGTLLDRALITGKLINHNKYDNTTMLLDDYTPNVAFPQVPKYISPSAFEQQPTKGFSEFQVPYYSPTLQSCAWNDKPYSLFDRPLPWLEVETCKLDSRDVRIHFASAASDDLDFNLFIGPPPVYDYQKVRSPIVVFKKDGKLISYRVFCFDKVAQADPCYEINGTFSQWPDLDQFVTYLFQNNYKDVDGKPIDLRNKQWSNIEKYLIERGFKAIKDDTGKNYELSIKDLAFTLVPPPFRFNVYSQNAADYQIALPAGSSSA